MASTSTTHQNLPGRTPTTGRILAATPAASKAPDLDKIIRIAQAEHYPIRAWYCILAFLAFVSFCHFSTLAYRLTRNSGTSKVSVTTKGAILISRLPLAAANAFRALAFRTSIPIGGSYVLNPAEVFVGAAYIAVIFSWSLVNTTSRKGVKFDPKYYANMAGNLAALQLPLVAALGSKNNIISLLTGISYNKLNYLHRMISRVLCILIWVHASGRIKIGLKDSLSLDHPWIRCGIVAATSLTLLSVISIRPIRNRNYEIFLVVHFLLVFIVLLGGYFHAQGIDAGFHVWPAFVVWGLDRFIRGIRIIVNNFGYFKNSRSIRHSARIDVLSERFVRVTVRRPARGNLLHWLPGQSVYLTIPEVSLFQAHPFTISTIGVLRRDDAAANKASSNSGEKDVVSSDGSLSSSAAVDSNCPQYYKELVFIAQVKSGFTKRLLRLAGSAAGKEEQNVKVIMDGPYGSPPLLRGYEKAVLIAGGSGITFTLPLFLDILRRQELGKNDCKRVCFIWVIRDARHIEWIADAVVPGLSAAPPGISIDFRVYVTGGAAEDEEIKVDSAGVIEQRRYPGMTLLFLRGRRPDLERVVEEEVGRSDDDTAVSVNVCGSAALAQCVRRALRKPRFFDVLRGAPTVDLHVESFEM